MPVVSLYECPAAKCNTFNHYFIKEIVKKQWIDIPVYNCSINRMSNITIHLLLLLNDLKAANALLGKNSHSAIEGACM